MTAFTSQQGYYAFKKEAAYKTALQPDVFIPLEAENLIRDSGILEDIVMKGNISDSQGIQYGPTSITGTVKIKSYPNLIGHWLDQGVSDAVTGAAADGVYPHTFKPDSAVGLNSGTHEFLRGDIPVRFFGSKVNSLRFFIEDKVWKVEAELMTFSNFSVTAVKVAASSGTALLLNNQTGKFYPGEGLEAAADSIIVGRGLGSEEELTVAAVAADLFTLTTGTISQSHSIGDIVSLKALTPSFTTVRPFNSGRTSVVFDGVTYNVREGFEFTLMNNLENFPAIGRRTDTFESCRKASGIEFTGLEHLFNDQGVLLEKLESGTLGSMVITMTGLDAGSGSGTDKLTITAPKTHLMGGDEAYQLDDPQKILHYNNTLKGSYDSGIGANYQALLNNTTATY